METNEMTTKTTEELDEMRNLIALGRLPPDAIERYYEDETRNVFGHDVKFDADGRPIEQGLGSASQPTPNSVDAYRKFGREEPAYHENLARMEAELAAFEAKRKTAKRRAALRAK
jgi:hypothetical protein